MSGLTKQLGNLTNSGLFPLPVTGSSILSGSDGTAEREANPHVNPGGINDVGFTEDKRTGTGSGPPADEQSVAGSRKLEEQVQEMKELQTLWTNIMNLLHEIKMTIINAIR